MDLSQKIVKERAKYEEVLENIELNTKEDAIEYARALTKLIWDYKQIGLVYEYYADDVLFKTANGRTLNTKEDVAVEFLGTLAAFTDIKVFIDETFAQGDPCVGFKVYQRSHCEGTNNGPSIYGKPTGRKLDEKNSMGMALYIFKKIEGRWRVATEYSIRSQYTIEKLLKNQD